MENWLRETRRRTPRDQRGQSTTLDDTSEQGYPGAYQNVVRITRYLKGQEVLGEPLPDASPGILAGHAAGILVKRSENRSEEEIQTLKRLKTIHWITERCCTLFEEFAGC